MTGARKGAPPLPPPHAAATVDAGPKPEQKVKSLFWDKVPPARIPGTFWAMHPPVYTRLKVAEVCIAWHPFTFSLVCFLFTIMCVAGQLGTDECALGNTATLALTHTEKSTPG